jgi:hypothetical protein
MKDRIIKKRGGGRFSQVTELPVTLIEAVNHHYSGTKDYHKALKIVDRVYSKLREKDCTEYHFCTEYKRDVGSDSTHLWKDLVKKEIFTGGRSYYTKYSKCKKYGIHPTLLNGRTEKITYEEHIGQHKELEKYAVNVLENITLDLMEFESIEELIRAEMPSIRLEITSNSSINSDGNVEYNDNGKITKHKLPKGLTPQQHLDSFIDDKLNDTFRHHAIILKILSEGMYSFPKRNDTNYRLNHILTNLPGRYFKYLRMEGEPLVEIDMRNSQFTLLANLMSYPYKYSLKGLRNDIHSDSTYLSKDIEPIFSTEVGVKVYLKLLHSFQKDVSLFKEYCYEGELYDKMVEELSMPREDVKTMFMKFLFGRLGDSPIELKFKESYPNVMNIIKEIKKHFVRIYKETKDEDLLNLLKNKKKSRHRGGMDYLSILLQRIESNIFIDHVYENLVIAGLPTLTKHDSVICKESDLENVERVMRSTLDGILGEGKYSLNIKFTGASQEGFKELSGSPTLPERESLRNGLRRA